MTTETAESATPRWRITFTRRSFALARGKRLASHPAVAAALLSIAGTTGGFEAAESPGRAATSGRTRAASAYFFLTSR